MLFLDRQDVIALLPMAECVAAVERAFATHAIDVSVEDIRPGQFITGQRPGRTSDEQIFAFDSTGTALQDVAAAAMVYQRAQAAGMGRELVL